MNVLQLYFPTYQLNNTPHYISYFDPDIGYIHQPNSNYTVSNNCIDLRYTYNSLGFLDNNFPPLSGKKRIVFLGDSFTEGFGVAPENRVSNLLEKSEGHTCLNWGITDKSPTQYHEIYRKYGGQFEHDALVIGLYPSNDFIDNDVEKYKSFQRPYWKKTGSDWKLIPPKKNYKHKEKRNWIKRFLLNYTYTYNAYINFKTAINQYEKPEEIGHFNFSNDDWTRLELSIREIRKLAPSKAIALYTIPSKSEILLDSLAKSPLIKKLKVLCAEIDIEFINVTEQISKQNTKKRKELYKTCDSHWSEKGHQFATDLFIKNWSYLHNN